MKTKLIINVFAFCYYMQAQNTWKVNGNNLSSGDYIGSSNARPLIFKTNNIERARFNTDGGLNISGSLKADSTTINNFLAITIGGNSFLFFPNLSFLFYKIICV